MSHKNGNNGSCSAYATAQLFDENLNLTNLVRFKKGLKKRVNLCSTQVTEQPICAVAGNRKCNNNEYIYNKKNKKLYKTQKTQLFQLHDISICFRVLRKTLFLCFCVSQLKNGSFLECIN